MCELCNGGLSVGYAGLVYIMLSQYTCSAISKGSIRRRAGDVYYSTITPSMSTVELAHGTSHQARDARALLADARVPG